jgi:outer membrane immunogenic protein
LAQDFYSECGIMRRLECAMLNVIAAFGFASAVSASDLPTKAPVFKVPAVALTNWTGFYIGGNAGISAGVAPLEQTSAFVPFPPSVNNQSSHDAFGAIGGLQAGYNLQRGSLVYGIEGDFQLSSQKSDPTCLTFCDFNFQNPTSIQFDSVSQQIPWFATLRGRFGYAAGPSLIYVTAGAAFANIKTTYSTTEFNNFTGTASDTRVGLALGGGIETALTGNWTAKIEYLYLNYGTVTDTFTYATPGGFGPPGTAASVVSGTVVDHVARVGVNYRFGDPPPAAATMSNPTQQAPLLARAWTGFYVGGNVGYGVGQDAATEQIFGLFGNSNQVFTLVPRGPLGGGQIGYNYAPNDWLVLGAEADYQFADQKDTACFSWCFAANTTYGQTLHWFATARGRIGIAEGRALYYVTGGGAWTTVETTASQVNSITTIAGTTFFSSAASFSDSRLGWVVGGGAEVAIDGNWSAKLEYLYMDFGSISHVYPAAIPTNLADSNIHISTKVHDSIFRLGLNYNFSAGSASY